ncbi:MAG: (Fe-S)-binding protein [Deltaproteobacteria bacterium]|nr:(Fe-S)-binding protein [Deltaproteobacteria bacterium]
MTKARPVGLFVPCYVDQLYPDVAMATLEVLEKQGLSVDFPSQQTCCGQPMANTGCDGQAEPLARRMVSLFANYDHIVCPSGSCVAMVRHHYKNFFGADDAAYQHVRKNTFELTEYLTDVLKVERIGGRFPHRVGLHASCHGLRELRLGHASELGRGVPTQDRARHLLSGLQDITLVELSRPDECCGFGGTFAVAEEAVSTMMGCDRIADHERAGAEIITAGDMSCLMHLEGLIGRQKKPIRIMHIAQILAGRPVDAEGPR